MLKAGAGWLRIFGMGGLLVSWFQVTCYKHFLWGRGGGVLLEIHFFPRSTGKSESFQR